MTTAGRATFDPARGGKGKWEGDLSAQSKQYSSRDLPAHTKLKYRNQGQGNTEDLRSKDFKRDLDERERNAVREKRDRDRGGVGERRDYKRQRGGDAITAANLDADEPREVEDEDVDLSGDDSDDEDALLMAELTKIKKERAAEAARREAERKQEEERVRMENILKGNPLINQQAANQAAGSYKVKRRWDDDVMFKNCARGCEDDKKKAVFINDTLRSEFHKKFMDKYIK